MSYFPYNPDVWPPEPVADPPARARIWKRAGLVLAYLLAVAGWVVWMKMPPRIQPPIATIPVPGGGELRLIYNAEGTDPNIRNGDTFGNRIRNQVLQPLPRVQDPDGGAWIVLTNYSDSDRKFYDPELTSCDIVEEGSPYALQPSRIEGGHGPFVIVLFPAVPRNSPTLTLSMGSRLMSGQTIKATIANPFWRVPSAPANSNPAANAVKVIDGPPPLEATSGDFTVQLNEVVFKKAYRAGLGAYRKAAPDFTVRHPAAKLGDYSYSYEWFDDGGNRVKNGILPWSDTVWGLRVLVEERASFPAPAERLVSLGNAKIPAPGQVIPLTVPGELRTEGVSDVWLIGSGPYSWNGSRLYSTSNGGANRAFAGTLTGPGRYGLMTVGAWELHTFYGMRRQPKPRDSRAQLRVRAGETILQSNSTGSSSNGVLTTEHLGNFSAGNTTLTPGTPVTVEAFLPKTHVFEFRIPRPAFPKTSPK